MSSTSSCTKCGKEASLRCSRCRAARYCSRDCQKADYKHHKAARPPASRAAGSAGEPSLLPEPFLLGQHLRCMKCGHVVMLCRCGGMSHGEALVFALPPIPSHFTVMQRIRRWAKLVSYHPLLQKWDAERFVQDRPPGIVSNMEFVKPILTDLMEKYKIEGTDELASKLGVPLSSRSEFKKQIGGDADYVMENFFAGNWGYPSHGEYFLLFNAVQMSGPEDFDAEVYPRFESVWEVINAITNMFRIVGITAYGFRLEDIENIVR